MIDRMFGDRDVMQLNLCYASYKTVVHRGVCNSVLFSENVELLPPYFYTVSSDQSNHHVQVQVRNKGVFIFSKFLWMKRTEEMLVGRE
ncbi:hypothetical protein T01_16199 [Trichinella spiralis]|uniref:Uncharacterized protein n=1 Tax=Trichinella spiralis TaxID=6334 RepID=A0A0V1C223_TRISP|nr:hypothetical protein T01_16199 [Trichinella spiralis]